MKNQIITLSVIAVLTLSVNAQNTFPSSGNVGVGTTTPDYKLHIKDGPGGAQLKFQRGTGLATIAQNYNVNDLYIDAPAGLYLNVYGGKVGVGTATPAQQLHIAKDGGPGGTYLYVQDLNTTNAGGIYVGSYQGNALIQTGAAGKAIAFWDYTGEKMRIASGGNVGINTTTPTAKLQVQNGSVLFDGTAGTTPVSGAGTRMMWIPAKAAFRAGYVGSDEWNDTNIGLSSFAAGENTKASGIKSFAAGYWTTASGAVSFAAGSRTTASGVASTAFGFFNTAQSYNSFVLGSYNYDPGTYNTFTWVATDPLFVIGNGTSGYDRSNAVTVLKNGNVGIGTTLANNPNNYRLAVAGIIAAKVEVVVENTSVTWPDFIFESPENRMNYAEKELFFQQNKHLPGIDSAKEIQRDGLQFVKTLAGLTQNVEENSLDIIDLSKQNAELKRELENLKKELNALKNK